MDRFLSRFVPPLLAFVAGAALMAGLGSSGTARLPAPEPTPEPVVEVPGSPGATPAPAGTTGTTNTAGQALPGPLGAAPLPPAEPEPDPALLYRLLGTVASSATGKGRAVVENVHTGATTDLSVGDQLGDSEVVEIAAGRVQLRRPDGTISEIQTQGSTRPPTEMPPGPQEIVPGASFADHLAAPEKRLIREQFGGDLVADYEEGVLKGWVVTLDPDRDPGKIFELAGLQPGDRITALNGMDLTEPATLLYLSQFPVPLSRLMFDVVTPDGKVRSSCE